MQRNKIMNNMKKFIFLFAAAMSLFVTMTACAKKKEKKADTQTVEAQSPQGRKILVAYFSATGTTEGVAKMIASTTGGQRRRKVTSSHHQGQSQPRQLRRHLSWLPQLVEWCTSHDLI